MNDRATVTDSAQRPDNPLFEERSLPANVLFPQHPYQMGPRGFDPVGACESDRSLLQLEHVAPEELYHIGVCLRILKTEECPQRFKADEGHFVLQEVPHRPRTTPLPAFPSQ